MIPSIDRSSLSSGGNEFLQLHIPNLIVCFLCTGMLVPVFSDVICSLVTRQKQSSWVTLIIVLLGFITLCVLDAEMVMNGRAQLRAEVMFFGSIVEDPGYGIVFNTAAGIIYQLDQWMPLILPVINDTFIIWRAWSIFGRRRWAAYISIILCLASVGILVAYAIVVAYDILHALMIPHSMETLLEYGPLIALVLSLVKNILATFFISWILWGYLKFLQQNFNTRQRQRYTIWRVLLILVEAGAVYNLLLIVAIVLHFRGKSTGAVILGNVITIVSIAFPTLTIFLVQGPFSTAHLVESVMSLYDTEPDHPVALEPKSSPADNA
ncbi:hypothetical protein E4T56_gene12061 [Termitomyces sp. T112]|nr:hypothetical protein E4T56_gene12061 [Termitomyces sp. T112]